jgi:hypothetical protein
LVFGINTFKLAKLKLFNMSEELSDFSEQIDEQFEIADIESDDFWEAIVNLFI